MDEIVTSNAPVMRYRVNAKTSVKGVITWDCTVEASGEDESHPSGLMNLVLEKQDELVKALRLRYPDPQE